MHEFRNIHFVFLVPIVILIIAVSLVTILAYSKNDNYIFEEKHEIVKGQIVSKYVAGGCFLSSEKYAIPVRVDGKQILFHTNMSTGMKVREKQIISLTKTSYITKTKRDGKIIKSSSYYNWYKWD